MWVCLYIGPQAQQSVKPYAHPLGGGSTDPQQYTSLIILAHLAANAECTARRGGGGGGVAVATSRSSAPQPRRARVKDQRQPTLLAVRGLLSKPNHSPNPNPNPNKLTPTLTLTRCAASYPAGRWRCNPNARRNRWRSSFAMSHPAVRAHV